MVKASLILDTIESTKGEIRRPIASEILPILKNAIFTC